MEIRTFRAASLQEALEQVRVSLGPEASILKTRSIKRGRLGLFGPSEIEVDASLHGAGKRSMNATDDLDSTIVGISELASQHLSTKDPHQPVNPQPPEQQVTQMMLNLGVAQPEIASTLQSVVAKLDAQQRLDLKVLIAAVRANVAHRLNMARPIAPQHGKQTVIAAVGAAGSGKTTVIAKLAAALQATDECRVGLVALDMLRVGAIDHLLHHAETLDLPLEIVSSAEQVRPALSRLQECDVVLIDTAGRPLDDANHVVELQSALTNLSPIAVLLCVNATNSAWHLKACWRRFAALSPHGLAITKMDEAAGLAAWLPDLFDSAIPVAYTSQGQDIRSGIAIADAFELTARILPFSPD